MADAIAEQIMDAVKTTLTGLTSTGSRVQRGQVYEHERDALPALALSQGADNMVAEHQTGLTDWELTVYIEAAAEKALDYVSMDAGIDTTLNQIRKEVHLALMADYTLGLDDVIDVRPVSASEPNLAGDGAKPLATMLLEFVVIYRSTRTDISQ